MSVVVNEFEVVPEAAQQQAAQPTGIPPAEEPALDEEVERVVRLRIDRLVRVHAT
jgi:hypothetical protein